MLIYFRLIGESFRFAINALRTNKLRTLLSLLGVTIGIFSIIAVLAAVDSLDKKIKDNLASLDKNTIYLAKFTFGPSEVPRWKRQQFPNVTYEEYQNLKNSLPDAQETAYQLFVGSETIKYDAKSVSSIKVKCWLKKKVLLI
jgi:putative ABC transport system permease protein